MSSKKVTKCIASILCAVMLITGISPGIVAKADAIDDLWNRVDKLQLPTQTEAAISIKREKQKKVFCRQEKVRSKAVGIRL